MNRNFFSIKHEIGGVVDKTPEVKVSQTGVKYYRINIVSKDLFKKKDGTTGTKMEFHNLTMFAGKMLCKRSSDLFCSANNESSDLSISTDKLHISVRQINPVMLILTTCDK